MPLIEHFPGFTDFSNIEHHILQYIFDLLLDFGIEIGSIHIIDDLVNN